MMLRLLALLVIASVSLSGCRESSQPASENLVPVQVVEAVERDFRQRLVFPGVTTAQLISDVGFQVAGEVTVLTKKVGDSVAPGQVLARVDSSTYQDEASSADAQVAVARSQLAEAEAGSRDQEVRQASAAVEQANGALEEAKASRAQARASLELAEIEYRRHRAVYEEKAISQQVFQQVEQEYKVAQEQFDAAGHRVDQAEESKKQAQAQYSLVLEGPRQEQVDTARANLRASQAQASAANNRVAFTTLKAPFAGTITRKHVEVGMVVNAGTPIFELRSDDDLEMAIQVPSSHIEKLKLGMSSSVSFDPVMEEPVGAKVIEIQPVNDQTVRNYQVKLKLEEVPFSLNLSGVIGEAAFDIGASLPGVEVPVSALIVRDGGYAVMVLKSDQTVNRVAVELLKLQDERARIQGPLKSGDPIIISGQEFVQNGRKVRVVKGLDSQPIITPDRDDPNKP